jgi:hypothetical protein
MSEHANSRKIDLADVSAEIISNEGVVTFAFSRSEGSMRSARWKFRDRNDLVEFLSDALNLSVVNGGLHGTVRRYRKYVRRNAEDETVTTFGDPILDLITNDYGELDVGGQRLRVGSAELREPKQRLGGLRSIDLRNRRERVIDYQLPRAAMGEGDFVLTECADGLVAFASTNPSQRDFYLEGDHLRFKAWKKSRFLYWSMGAEIETWGHDFARARIDSRYLDTVVGQTCAAVKVDSDEDTNDDYVDEYEWGINSPQPLRVVSLCTAWWKNRTFSGQVEAGPTCFEV